MRAVRTHRRAGLPHRRPAPSPAAPRCRLGASTIHRWLDEAGARAEQTIPDQLVGIASSGHLGTDGRWARLARDARRVVLLLTDSVSGVVWPPVVVAGEDDPAAWGALVARAQAAGRDPAAVAGLTSDGSRGLAQYLEQAWWWVNHQRCVWHIWHHLSGKLTAAAAAAAQGLAGAAATAVRQATRRTLAGLVRAVRDAADDAAAVAALQTLAAHPLGTDLAAALRNEVEAVLTYRGQPNQGLCRVAPEWIKSQGVWKSGGGGKRPSCGAVRDGGDRRRGNRQRGPTRPRWHGWTCAARRPAKQTWTCCGRGCAC